jgi:iron complex transport system permease protein
MSQMAALTWYDRPDEAKLSTAAVRGLSFALFAAALWGVFILELSIGPVSIPTGQIVKAVFGLPTQRDTWAEIVWTLRMPRAITAVVASSALSLGGLILQTLFRNPLAGPWVLGITAGARFGVAAVLAMEAAAMASLPIAKLNVIGDVSLTTGACLGAVLVLILVALIAPRVSAVTLLIVGLMIQYLGPSLTGILLHLVTQDQYTAYQAWSGSEFGATTWPQLRFLVPAVVACMALAVLLAKPLNAMLLGESYARSTGVNVTRTRVLSLASMIGLAGMVTAYCGAITFLDLAVPHLCRGIFKTSDHRILMPAVALVGGFIGLAADLIVHLPWERHVLHIDYVTALIGAPIILWLLLGKKHMRNLV